MSSSELQSDREFARAAPLRGPEARAAAAALVMAGADEVEDWSALFARAAELGLWGEALEIAHAAARRRPESAAVALLVPAALAELKRLGEAHRAFEAVAAAFPDDFEALDRLASITWHRGYLPGALQHVEEAVARGLRGRDHIIQMGTSSATMMGRFDRARELSDDFVDEALRLSTLEKIRIAEAEWRASGVQLEEAYAGEISVSSLEAMLEAGQFELTRHAAIRLIVTAPSAEHLEFLIHRMHPLGPPGWFLSQWAGYKGAREFPGHPAFLWSEAGVLLQRGAFEDAGRLLLKLVDSNVHPEFLLRWMVFAAAGGGLSREQLSDAATRLAERGSRDGAYRLVRSFLAGHRLPGALDLPDSAEGGTSPLHASVPGRRLRRFYLSPRLRRPRIAVCLSGQLRSYRRTWPGSRAALAAWDTTVFLSTWRDTGLGFGMHDSADRLLPGQVQQRLPLHLRRRTTFETRLPKVFAAMTRTSSVTSDELVELFDTSFVRVHDEPLFESRHCQGRPGLEHLGSYNQAKMFFTMADANAMKAEFELGNGLIFDAVLRLRPDRQLTRLGDIDLERAIDRRVILSDYLHAGGVGDQVILSSSEVADIYSEIWPRLDAHGSPAYFPGNSGKFAEDLMAEHMMAHGVEVGAFRATYAEWLSAEAMPLSTLWAAVLEELAGPAAPDSETGAIVGAFCEAVAEDAGSDPGAYARPDAASVQRWGLLDGLSERARRFVEGR